MGKMEENFEDFQMFYDSKFHWMVCWNQRLYIYNEMHVDQWMTISSGFHSCECVQNILFILDAST